MIADILLSIALGTIVIWCGVWFFGIYCNAKCSCDRCTSFEKFLTIYENAPEKVDLYEGYFSYLYYDEECSYISNKISFNFSIPDTVRYEHWRKELKRKKEKEKVDAAMKKVEELWYEDAVNASLRNADEKKAGESK